MCDVDFSPLSEASVEKDRTAASRKTKQVTSSAAIGRVGPSLTEEGLSGRNAAEHAAARSTKLTSLSPSENRARTHPPLSPTSPTAIARAEGSPKSRGVKLTGDALFSVDSKANAYGDGLGEMELRAENRTSHPCDTRRELRSRTGRFTSGHTGGISVICSICSTPCATASPSKTPDTTEPWQCFATEDSALRRCPFAPTQPEAQQDAFASSSLRKRREAHLLHAIKPISARHDHAAFDARAPHQMGRRARWIYFWKTTTAANSDTPSDPYQACNRSTHEIV